MHRTYTRTLARVFYPIVSFKHLGSNSQPPSYTLELSKVLPIWTPLLAKLNGLGILCFSENDCMCTSARRPLSENYFGTHTDHSRIHHSHNPHFQRDAPQDRDRSPPPPPSLLTRSVSVLALLQPGIQQGLFRFSWSEVAVGATGQPCRKSFSTVSNQAVLLFDRVRLCLSPLLLSFSSRRRVMADLWLFCRGFSAAGLCEDSVVGRADGRCAKP